MKLRYTCRSMREVHYLIKKHDKDLETSLIDDYLLKNKYVLIFIDDEIEHILYCSDIGKICESCELKSCIGRSFEPKPLPSRKDKLKRIL